MRPPAVPLGGSESVTWISPASRRFSAAGLAAGVGVIAAGILLGWNGALDAALIGIGVVEWVSAPRRGQDIEVTWTPPQETTLAGGIAGRTLWSVGRRPSGFTFRRAATGRDVLGLHVIAGAILVLGVAMLLASAKVWSTRVPDAVGAALMGIACWGVSVWFWRRSGILPNTVKGDEERLRVAVVSGARSGSVANAVFAWAIQWMSTRNRVRTASAITAAMGVLIFVGVALPGPARTVKLAWQTTVAALELGGFAWLILTTLTQLGRAAFLRDAKAVRNAAMALVTAAVMVLLGYWLGLLDPWIKIGNWIA